MHKNEPAPQNKFYERIRHLPPEVFASLSQIDQLKGRWSGGAGLGTQALDRLKQSALVTSAGASTRIEGSQMSDDEVRALLNGLKTTKLRERDKAEVEGYLAAEAFIHDHYQDINLTENHFKQIHQILLQYSEKDERHRGEYKHFANDVVARDASGREVGVVFRTLPPLETPIAMQNLVEWLDFAMRDGILHPLLITAGFVVEFLRIHPFIDGNGRMSRLLTDLLMLKSGFSYVSYVSLEKIIEENKADYYLALRRSQETFDTPHEDIAAWTDFFLKVCLEQAKQAIALLTADNIELNLSQNQATVYRIARELGEFAIKDIEERVEGISRATIRQAVEKLEAMGAVVQYGAGRGSYYKIA